MEPWPLLASSSHSVLCQLPCHCLKELLFHLSPPVVGMAWVLELNRPQLNPNSSELPFCVSGKGTTFLPYRDDWESNKRINIQLLAQCLATSSCSIMLVHFLQLNEDNPQGSVLWPLFSLSDPLALGEQFHFYNFHSCFPTVDFHDHWCHCASPLPLGLYI